MRFQFNRELYSKTALLKAAYNYTDKAFLHLDADDRYYYVYLEMKSGADPISEKAFTNEMLAQSVRHEVYLQTKNIRELMLARAMATTIVDEKEGNSQMLRPRVIKAPHFQRRLYVNFRNFYT